MHNQYWPRWHHANGDGFWALFWAVCWVGALNNTCARGTADNT